MTLLPGSRFGPYEIGQPLGQGGMATVYQAYEPELDRHVALKVLPVEFLRDPAFAERFQREARVVARLEHPNIVPIFAFGIEAEQGIPWMAMRLISGGHAADRIGENRLNISETIALVSQVADALDYAHGQGVIHRDIKPQNILLDQRGRVYLADFGIARLVESSTPLTRSGVITGTPQYMAPEQATGEPIDHRSDIYSLGIVTYKILTGRAPFDAPTPVAMLMKHANEPVPVPAAELVPQPLLAPLMKALQKRPRDRWQSAGEFAGALEHALAELTSPPERRPQLVHTPGDPTSPSLSVTMSRVARKPVFWAASAVALGSLAGLVVLAGLGLWLGSSLLGGAPPRVPEPTPVPTPAALAVPHGALAAGAAFSEAEPEPDPPSPSPGAAPRRSAARPTAAPATASETEPTPAAVARINLRLAVDAAQDPRNPAAVDELLVQIEVAGERQPPLRLRFGRESAFALSRSRVNVALDGVPGGTQQVVARVGSGPSLDAAAWLGSTRIQLRDGMLLPLEIRERIDGSRDIRFR